MVSVCAGGVSVARPGVVGGLGALKNHKVFVDKGAGIEDARRKGEAAHERRRGGASPISTPVFGVEVGVSCAPGAMSMDMALLSFAPAPGAMSMDMALLSCAPGGMSMDMALLSCAPVPCQWTWHY